MPKASKKKKEKAADFSKAKLKLGKGKTLPSNVIDTSFKARSIALPSQSIAAEKDGNAPTTKRRLTFDDLMLHLKHHNASTRRDALLGIRELFEAHNDLVEDSLTVLFGNCVRLIGDEDASVRRALLALFTWLLPIIPADIIQPHASFLLLFTTSAQTHIFPEIRIDAVRFLDLYMDVFPEAVVQGWQEIGKAQKQEHGARVLDGYLGVLNAGTKFGEAGDTGPVRATSTASVVLSPISKLTVLKSLGRFLRTAVSTSDIGHSISHNEHMSSPTPTWYFKSSFSEDGFESFESLCRISSSNSQRTTPSRIWTEEPGDGNIDERAVDGFYLARKTFTSSTTIQELSSVVDEVMGAMTHSEGDQTLLSRLAHTLYPIILSTFLDCAPTVFSPSGNPPETELKMVIAATEIADCLYSSLLRGEPEGEFASMQSSRAELDQLLKRMAPYFPFMTNGSKRDIKIEQSFQDLNIVFCELTSLLLLSSSSVLHSRPSPPPHLREVVRFVTRLIRGETSSGVIARSISAPAYHALLPTIWSLLCAPQEPDEEEAETVLHVVVTHATRAPSTSAIKRPTIEFLGRLVLLETERRYKGSFRLPRGPDNVELKALVEWLIHLPKTLWEIGANDAEASEAVIRLLLRVAQRRLRLATKEVLDSICTRLVPFFTVSHATRGLITGPYARISSPQLRRLALDLVAVLLADGPPSKEALVSAVEVRVSGTDEERYWANIKAGLSSPQ